MGAAFNSFMAMFDAALPEFLCLKGPERYI
jgi:hypothetical protein